MKTTRRASSAALWVSVSFALALAAGLGCSGDASDATPDDDGPVQLGHLGKADGGSQYQLTLGAGESAVFELTAPDPFRVSVTQEGGVELLVTASSGTDEYTRSDLAAEPTLMVARRIPEVSDPFDPTEARYTLTIENLGDDATDAALEIDTDMDLGACSGTEGTWATDPVVLLADCAFVVDGAYDEEPAATVLAADLCLAKADWGLNGHPYYVLQGDIEWVGEFSEHTRAIYLTQFVDSDDDSTVTESEDGVEIDARREGAVITENRDFRHSIELDREAATLVYREASREWFTFSWDYDYSALLSCEVY